jgi:hypothetical protein
MEYRGREYDSNRGKNESIIAVMNAKMTTMKSIIGVMNAKMAIMNVMIAIKILTGSVIETVFAYFNANLIVSAKASGTKFIAGRMSSSGFQSSERFTGALGNL